jgi:hypothetical protein
VAAYFIPSYDFGFDGVKIWFILCILLLVFILALPCYQIPSDHKPGTRALRKPDFYHRNRMVFLQRVHWLMIRQGFQVSERNPDVEFPPIFRQMHIFLKSP